MTLTITRGLPGSGKTTWARTQPAWRVNRDDLRAMLNDQWPYGDKRAEDLLTAVQHHAIKTFLSVGFEVVVDDTNLHPLHVDAFRTIADECDADLRIKDFTDVPLEVCIERDATRPNPVGEHVIRRMWAKYLAPQGDAPVESPAGQRSFEDLLADPNGQFDPRAELLASITEYTNAPPASASTHPKRNPPAVTQ